MPTLPSGSGSSTLWCVWSTGCLGFLATHVAGFLQTRLATNSGTSNIQISSWPSSRSDRRDSHLTYRVNREPCTTLCIMVNRGLIDIRYINISDMVTGPRLSLVYRYDFILRITACVIKSTSKDCRPLESDGVLHATWRTVTCTSICRHLPSTVISHKWVKMAGGLLGMSESPISFPSHSPAYAIKSLKIISLAVFSNLTRRQVVSLVRC